MSNLNIRGVNFSPDTDSKLRRLKGATGVTPNLLCRVGFCLSLEEPQPPVLSHYPVGPRIINRYTLTGEFDELFVSLLKQFMFEHGQDWNAEANDQFAGHMNRGVEIVAARVRSLGDLLALWSEAES